MTAPNYADAPYPVRRNIVDAHARAWARLAAPGTWFDGPRRLAIAAETRAAEACALCRERKAALSPAHVDGRHDSASDLPAALIEVVHRIATDAPRLSQSWYRERLAAGIGEGEYVEAVGVIATIIGIDRFARCLGLAPRPLPTPRPGAPSRRRPAGAKAGLAWVPTLAPEDVGPDDPPLYRNLSAVNIHRALSLVPEEVIGFFDLDSVQYLPDAQLRRFEDEPRDLSHAQIELLAARVSALNACVY